VLTEVPGLNLYRADACEQQAKDANLRAERVRAQLLSLDVPCININFSPYIACMRSNKAFLSFFNRIQNFTIISQRKILKSIKLSRNNNDDSASNF
jgi:hypothetical protein